MSFGEPMTFGALLYRLRVERRWTQEQLARLSGVTVNSISNLERQITLLPNIETVERLARAFGLDPEDLDSRILADRVEQEAVSLPRRQAIKWMLSLSDRDMETVKALAEEMNRPKPKRRRRS
jgi:transcriptional regulator with XRE-family HTH domain